MWCVGGFEGSPIPIRLMIAWRSQGREPRFYRYVPLRPPGFHLSHIIPLKPDSGRHGQTYPYLILHVRSTHTSVLPSLPCLLSTLAWACSSGSACEEPRCMSERLGTAHNYLIGTIIGTSILSQFGGTACLCLRTGMQCRIVLLFCIQSGMGPCEHPEIPRDQFHSPGDYQSR